MNYALRDELCNFASAHNFGSPVISVIFENVHQSSSTVGAVQML